MALEPDEPSGDVEKDEVHDKPHSMHPFSTVQFVIDKHSGEVITHKLSSHVNEVVRLQFHYFARIPCHEL